MATRSEAGPGFRRLVFALNTSLSHRRPLASGVFVSKRHVPCDSNVTSGPAGSPNDRRTVAGPSDARALASSQRGGAQVRSGCFLVHLPRGSCVVASEAGDSLLSDAPGDAKVGTPGPPLVGHGQPRRARPVFKHAADVRMSPVLDGPSLISMQMHNDTSRNAFVTPVSVRARTIKMAAEVPLPWPISDLFPALAAGSHHRRPQST
jgi:hypothetical protein